MESWVVLIVTVAVCFTAIVIAGMALMAVERACAALIEVASSTDPVGGSSVPFWRTEAELKLLRQKAKRPANGKPTNGKPATGPLSYYDPK